MRLGIITDVHLNPPGTPPVAWHNPYRLDDAAERFARAVAQCIAAEVDALAILGDLCHLGDPESLAEGVALATAAPMPVLFVPGNHDVTEQPDALATAITRHGAAQLRLATPDGELIAGVCVAGLSALRGTTWFDAQADALPNPQRWNDALVVWLTHFPMLSLADVAERAELRYPGDLGNLPAVAGPLVMRTAPTLVLHGHAHLRTTISANTVLQIGCGALIEPPFDVTLVEVNGSPNALHVRVEHHSMAESAAARLPVLAPQAAVWAFENGGWVAAG
jgi:DNA repair exonuclease SbcCD nuclease subunit